MRKVRWGVLGTAKIARTFVIPAMQKGNLCTVEAIASRSESKASQAATLLGIPKSYGSYEALLEDTGIDAVYIPLPNHLHVLWAIKALEAGKHVLCEKPLALSCDQAQELADAAAGYPDLKIMEAFMYKHHPQWREALRIVQNGGVGELLTIQSFFSYFNDDAGNIRNNAAAGGGGLMDIGCYCISLSRFLFETEPQRCCAFMNKDPRYDTDRLFSGIMDFGGRISSFTCSTQLSPYQRVNILGTEGRVEILIPFNAPNDEPCTLDHQQLGGTWTQHFDVCDQYTLQGDLFAEAILENTEVPVSLQDAVNNMKVLEDMKRAAESTSWVSCC